MQKHNLKAKRAKVITQKVDHGLGDYPRQFRAYLESRSYSPATLARYIRAVDGLGSMMRTRGVVLGNLDEAKAVSLFSKLEWPDANRKHGNHMVKGFIRFLIEQGVKLHVPMPTPAENTCDKLRQDYENYLRNERGLSERTISDLWYLIDRFLKFRFGDDMGNLSGITPIDIVKFMQKLHSGEKPYRNKTVATHLRRFFQFLFKAGRTKINLSLSIPSVAQRYGQKLPRHLLSEQVEALLTAVRSDTPMGRRNYTMLLLLARLGLRPPEVIAMRIDDIDWRSGEILIRGKGELHDRVPLPQGVGEALADYIRLDRVSTSRVLFVTERAPHDPFKDSQILNEVLKEAFAKAGLKLPTRYVGSHILRHSLATNLVQRGASLDEIANVLRHRSRATTMTYAKLDIDGLRSIALPWPVKGGGK